MTEQAGEKAPSKEQGLQHGPAQPDGRSDPNEQPLPRHTPGGAPTDAAHQDAGDGALTGSVPAGLTTEELSERASKGKSGDPGVE
jgi:hypothetical protein